jgi:hypothetical protein
VTPLTPIAGQNKRLQPFFPYFLQPTTARKLRGSPRTRRVSHASFLLSGIRSERSNLPRSSLAGTSLNGLSDVPEKQLHYGPTLKGVVEIGRVPLPYHHMQIGALSIAVGCVLLWAHNSGRW